MKKNCLINKKNKMGPTKMIVLSFVYVILAGTILLMMPFSSKNGMSVGFVDALFTATSATCVTGLAVFDTFTQWTFLGQVIILALIQVGGLGLVTLTTFFTIAVGKKLGFKSVHLAQESISFNNIVDISGTIKKVIFFSITVEAIGAVLLSTVFIPKQGFDGVFTSIFLSISAFCNAGFDILGSETPFASLTNYYDNPMVLGTIAALIITGGLGFLVWTDLGNFKKNKKLMLHTKMVLIVTGILLVGGTILIAILEWDNTLKDFTITQKIGNSFFQSVSTRTAGFNTIDIEAMNSMTKLLFIFLMFIGASPGSTGGGIKVTTVGVAIMTVISVVRGFPETIIMKRKVSKKVVYKAFSIIIIGVSFVFVTFFAMHYGENVSPIEPINALFEATSAFATVGLSAGVTTELNNFSLIVTVITMFVGRVGTLAIFIAMCESKKNAIQENKINPEGVVIV